LSILVIVVVAFLAKVLVADKIIELDKIKAANASVKAQIDAEYAEIEAFADIEEEYAHYTYSGFSEAEKNKADRLNVINLLDKYIIPRGSVRTWVLNDNMLTLSIADLSLESLNTMVDQLENDSLVNFVTVTTASTPTENNQTVTASVTIYLNGPLSAAE
ncbi:MAG: hypothetical protein HUJ75_06935, partial [Parasporobacterium sp.]|nr:hypothetical protein [Parasporobacterium sp.]